MFTRPRRTYAILVGAAIVAFAASATGGNATLHSGGARYWVAAAGWATFGVVFLATVAYSVALGLRQVTRRRATTTIN